MKNKTLLAIFLVILASTTFSFAEDIQSTQNSPTVASFLTEANLAIEQNWQNNAYQVEGRVASESYDMQKINGWAYTDGSKVATIEGSLYQDSNRTNEFSLPGLKVSVTDASKMSLGATSMTDGSRAASVDALNQRFGYAEASLNPDGSVFAGTYLSSKFDASASGQNVSLYGESFNAKALTVMGDGFYSQSAGSISIQPTNNR